MSTIRVGGFTLGDGGSQVQVAGLSIDGSLSGVVQVAELSVDGVAVIGVAGDDDFVNPGELVTLAGTGTGTGTWSQTAGPSVGALGAGFNVTYTAPRLAAGTSLTFRLTTTDGITTTTDDVTHTVYPQQFWRLVSGVLTATQPYIYA